MKKFLAAFAIVLLFPAPSLAAAEIVPGSVINLVARDARIPVTISNPDAFPVEVTLRAESTSFRLEVQEEVAVSIPAQSTEVAELPVRAIRVNLIKRFTVKLDNLGGGFLHDA